MSPDQTASSVVCDAGVAARGGLEALRGLLRVVPVAHGDERAAVDELALLARLARRAVGAHDEDLGVRDRLADRVRPAVDLGRVQVGRAERLGQAVHQVGLGLREDRAQLLQRRLRHAPAGVGEVAQAPRRLERPLLLGELDPQRRDAREPGDLVLGAQAHDVAREQVVDQHDVGADREGGRQLAEAGVEAERQRGEDDVVGVVLEVLADARAAHEHVAVREHDALRLAGAAGGVEDRGHVDVDHVAARRARRRSRNASHSSPSTITCSTAVSCSSSRRSSRRSAVVTSTRTLQSARM